MAMGRIGPRLTGNQLKESAEKTQKGEGLVAGIPGVEADAERMDRRAHTANRDLAKRIREAVAATKPSDENIPRFVLGWRLYPNRDNPFWNDAGGPHVCGCGCACYSFPPDDDNNGNE
jgi:hypothetical protein